MGVLIGGAVLVIAVACIILALRTGKALLPFPTSMEDLLLPIAVDRKANPGGFTTCLLVYALAAVAALAIVAFSVLSGSTS